MAKNQFGSRLGIWASDGIFTILAAATEVKVHEVVNDEFYVTFNYPLLEDDAERYAALVEDNIVAFPEDVERGQSFSIRKVDEIKVGRRTYKVVEAWHVGFGLDGFFMDQFIDFAPAQTLPDMLSLLGSSTPYSFVVEGSFDPQDIFNFGEQKKFVLLQQLRQLYNAELRFDNYEITLTTRKGGNYGARVRDGLNLKGIQRHSHNMERITRLYGYGKDGLTIEGYAGYTVKYIDSPYFSPFHPFMDKKEWPDIDDQGALLQAMQKHLAQYELPAYSWDVDFVQLEKVDPDFKSEAIREAGDTVTVTVEDLGYKFDARAWTFDRYPFARKSGAATLANFRMLTTADYIFSATVGSKKAISYTSRNAVLKGVKYDDSLTLVDGFGAKVTDADNVTRVRLGQYRPGVYGLWLDSGAIEISGGIPNSQVQGAADWDAKTTLLTSTGIYTGLVKASQLDVTEGKITTAMIETLIVGSNVQMGPGASISWSQVTDRPSIPALPSYIKSTYIDATTIQSPSIYGPFIATSTGFPRIELSATNQLLVAYSSATSYLNISAFGSAYGSSYLEYVDGTQRAITYFKDGLGYMLQTTLDIHLRPNGNVNFEGWNRIVNLASLQTLQGALDNKADWGHTHSISDISGLNSSLGSLTSQLYSKAGAEIQTGSSTGGNHNHSIPEGTRLAIWGSGNTVSGYVTYSAYGGWTHSHTQI